MPWKVVRKTVLPRNKLMSLTICQCQFRISKNTSERPQKETTKIWPLKNIKTLIVYLIFVKIFLQSTSIYIIKCLKKFPVSELHLERPKSLEMYQWPDLGYVPSKHNWHFNFL